MIEKEKIFNEYAGFREKFSKLIENVKTKLPVIYYHIDLELKVLDFLFDELIDNENFGETEHMIFTIGFHHVEEIVLTINHLLEEKFDNDFERLVQISTELNYFILIKDYYNDLSSLDTFDKDLLNDLDAMVIEIKTYIDNLNHISDKLKLKYDNLLERIVFELPDDYMTIGEVFESIAMEYNLI